MTNAQIIFNEQVRLMEEGIIGTTGRTLKMQAPDGTISTINEPEPIHTFAAWKELGYGVNKGEHAIAKFTIWKYSSKAKKGDEEGEEDGHCFMKLSHFFKASQVSKLAKSL